jgi:hypothetical protein
VRSPRSVERAPDAVRFVFSAIVRSIAVCKKRSSPDRCARARFLGGKSEAVNKRKVRR